VAAVEGVGPDEIDGAGDEAPAAPGHDQQDAIGHALSDQRVEFTRQVRPAPFARSGLHVEGEEGVPDRFGQIGAGEPLHLEAGRQGVTALAPDRLALAGRQRRQEVVERAVPRILPMELLIGPPKKAVLAEQPAFLVGRERHMHRGGLVNPAQLDETGDERVADPVGIRARADQQATAGRRGERDRHLNLGIILPAGALVGLGPALVEYVFAAGMGFQVAWHEPDRRARSGFGEQVPGQPSGPCTDRSGRFERI